MGINRASDYKSGRGVGKQTGVVSMEQRWPTASESQSEQPCWAMCNQPVQLYYPSREVDWPRIHRALHCPSLAA